MQNTDSNYFQLVIANDTKSLKLSQNFEDVNYISSLEKVQLSLIECLTLQSKNIFAKTVLYDDLDRNKPICKSYSDPPQSETDLEISQSAKSRIYAFQRNPPLSNFIKIYICKNTKFKYLCV